MTEKSYKVNYSNTQNIVIDNKMSDTSENAVQNKTVKYYVDNKTTNTLVNGENSLTLNEKGQLVSSSNEYLFTNSTEEAGGDSVALGGNAQAKQYATVAVGYNSKANNIQTIALGYKSENYIANTITFIGSNSAYNKILTLLNTDSIFFFNEQPTMDKNTLEAYTNGKTLTQVLLTLQNKITVTENEDGTVDITIPTE